MLTLRTDGSPIIPISAQLKFNIDAINEYLVTKIPVPLRDFSAAPHMIVIRSFDVNKPGAEIEELKGGVAGGSILTGVLKLGDEIEIRPGIVSKDDQGKIKCRPIYSRVVSLFAEHNDLKFAVPGGLIGKPFPLTSSNKAQNRHRCRYSSRPNVMPCGSPCRFRTWSQRTSSRNLQRARSQLLPPTTASWCEDSRWQTSQGCQTYQK